MARTVKEYDERYAEFLEVAQALFYSKGYEQTSVKEIIDTVGVAKGTFYHYFDSKVDLLESLVQALAEQLYAQALASLEPMLADETIGASEKFERLFAHVGQWKAANPGFVREAVHVFYQDQNVLLRAKMLEAATEKVAPLFAALIHQGVQEGTFDVPYPDEAAQFLFALDQALSQAVAHILLAGQDDPDAVSRVKRKLVAYERGIERILGVPDNSLQLIDLEQVEMWFSLFSEQE
ncbi:MAG TPA: TetR/AcrR family transcriptional regulator [Candidatus Sulfomarinibacteraceae bacterium]|nr:TetR/AcrR family transcriptional regulator [Candidatus Sulfomarinibacteraceae bacterium]